MDWLLILIFVLVVALVLRIYLAINNEHTAGVSLLIVDTPGEKTGGADPTNQADIESMYRWYELKK
jgi:hypothetical protein